MQTAKTISKITPGLKKEIVKLVDDRIREAHVTKEDFSELKAIVKELSIKTLELTEAQKKTEISINELTEAQKKSEERLTRVEVAVAELTEAQKKSEERLTRVEVAVAELTEAQKKTEISINELTEAQKKSEERLTRVEVAVAELTEAQKKTEISINELTEAQKKSEERLTRVEVAVAELTEAQKKTEIRMNELAEAQKKTDEALATLIKEHAITRKMLGGLSDTVGYRLEDEAFKALPRLLKENYGIEIKGRLKRTYLMDDKGRHIEINIFGEGTKEKENFTIIGESKSQLSKNDVDSFIDRKLKLFKGVFQQIFPVLVTYMISEFDVEDYAKSKGIAVFYSYDF